MVTGIAIILHPTVTTDQSGVTTTATDRWSDTLVAITGSMGISTERGITHLIVTIPTKGIKDDRAILMVIMDILDINPTTPAKISIVMGGTTGMVMGIGMADMLMGASVGIELYIVIIRGELFSVHSTTYFLKYFDCHSLRFVGFL